MKNKNIESLFRDSFEFTKHKVPVSKGLWGAIKTKYIIAKFLKFGAASFNIYYAGVVIIATTSVITYNVAQNNTNQVNPTIKPVKITEQLLEETEITENLPETEKELIVKEEKGSIDKKEENTKKEEIVFKIDTTIIREQIITKDTVFE